MPSGLQSHGRDLLLSAAQTICVIVDSKVVVHRRRPDAIKLACVGVAHEAREPLSGLSGQRHVPAGAAFGQRRVWDVGAVQTSFNQMSRLLYEYCTKVHMTHATSQRCSQDELFDV